MHIPMFLETERFATSHLAARIAGTHERITSSELSVEGPFTVITSKSPAYLSHLKLLRVSFKKAPRFIVLITIEKDGIDICLNPKNAPPTLGEAESERSEDRDGSPNLSLQVRLRNHATFASLKAPLPT